MKTPEDEAFEELERRTRPVKKPQDEIEHMWKVASNNPNHDSNWHDPVVIAFAKLVAQHEREACADIAENWNSNGFPRTGVANEIRARGKQA